jgi:hypothetical protein
VPIPSADAFAALARSSPWRWSTLRFTVRRVRPDPQAEPLRAWLRRPDVLRVETLDGRLRQIVREPPAQVGVLTSGGGDPRSLPWPGAAGAPVLRPDGLVAERPHGVSYDAPMYQDYHWVAMLDPVELADGNGAEAEFIGPLSIDSVTEVDHAGRRAWEAIVDPTPEYEPRCGCCPLLRSWLVDVREWGDGSEVPLTEYPEVYRVRLDVETWVCVLTEPVGVPIPGVGHDLRIEAVDEPMADGLFLAPRRGRFRRR